MHLRALAGGAALAAALVSCRAATRLVGDLFRERPPAPLDAMTLASDARVDSLGRLVGSFVGEGTRRAVHLLSSDTALIADLVRRYHPALPRRGDVWTALARAGVVTVQPRAGPGDRGRGPWIPHAQVGSPGGYTDVVVTGIVLRGSRCGWSGAQAELIVEDRDGDRDPDLRGPVLGALHPGSTRGPADGGSARAPLPEPSRALIRELVERTRRVRDSALGVDFNALALAAPARRAELEINTLADVDAADVVPFRVDGGRVRYAVSLRERRVTARGDLLLASTVMAWDSAGVWQQTIFRPTLLDLARGEVRPYGGLRRTYYWRRLEPVSDFGFRRDNLWMEQVDVRDGRVLWGIVEPRGNVVVAAALAESGCR